VPSSAIRSVLESKLGSVLEDVLGGVFGSVLELTWEHAIKCIRQFGFKLGECTMMYSIKST
jgi:hypothetical protein